MILYVDSREQMSLDFKGEVFQEVRVKKLDFGDYACENDGQIIPITFERKSLADLFGTMGKGYKRFKKEMERAANANHQLVLIIEGTLTDVYGGYEYSQIRGDSLVKKLFMLWVRYDLVPVFCESRDEMSRFIEETYDAVKRNYTKGSK